MKISIDGTVYGLQESINRASLGDLLKLKKELGVSAKTISATFKKFGGANVIDLLDDEDVLRDLQGVVFLSKRKAGESLTVQDAGTVSFSDIEFVDDDEDAEDDEPNPKA